MPTEDAYSSGHLILSHFGTCKCSNVDTNVSWTCLVSGFLSFEHPLVLQFFLRLKKIHKYSLISSGSKIEKVPRGIRGLKDNYFIVLKRKRKISDSVLWQKPLHRQKNPKKQRDNTKTPPKTSITQRLQIDLGRSVWVTIATQLVWFNRFTGSKPSYLPQRPCNQKDTKEIIRTISVLLWPTFSLIPVLAVLL